MKSRKIYFDALVLAQPKMSGIGHLTLQMVYELVKNPNYEVTLLVPLRKAKSVRKHNIEGAKIKSYPIFARIFSALLRLKLLPPMDVFFGKGVYIFPNYRNWPLLRSSAYTYFHDPAFKLYPQTVSPKNLKYLTDNYEAWSKRSKKILTLSQSAKNDLVNSLNIDQKKIEIVPCGIDPEVFRPRSEKEIKKVLKKYNITAKNYILFVGNIEPRKNLDNLLNAYQELPAETAKKHPLLIIGGGGWLNDSTNKLMHNLKNKDYKIITTKKYVEDDDLPAIYSGARLTVHPAIYEGFGLPPLQSLACGKPIAVSDIQVMREIFNSNVAEFFDPSSPAAIRSSLNQVLSGRSEFNKKQADIITHQFTWANSAKILSKIIDDNEQSKN